MFGRNRESEPPAEDADPVRLKDAVRAARIESAERSGVVVDLRDAELARLELLKDELDPVFAEVSPEVELFEPGISQGDTPRLWVDAVAHVHMGRDKRMYRFVQDSRYGRKVLAESFEPADIVSAVTRYVARRLVERERALTDEPALLNVRARRDAAIMRRRRHWRAFGAFILGLLVGVLGIFIAAWLLTPPA